MNDVNLLQTRAENVLIFTVTWQGPKLTAVAWYSSSGLNIVNENISFGMVAILAFTVRRTLHWYSVVSRGGKTYSKCLDL